MTQDRQLIAAAYELGQGMRKIAKGGRVAATVARVPMKILETLAAGPMAMLAGMKGRGRFAKLRLRPRPGSSVWKPISMTEYIKLKARRHPVRKIKGRYYKMSKRYGGIIGAAQRHPIVGGATALMVADAALSPRKRQAAELQRRVMPMSPGQIPAEYRV